MDDPQSIQLSSLLFGTTITLANVVLPQIRGALSGPTMRSPGSSRSIWSPPPLRHQRPVGWGAGSAGGVSCSAPSARWSGRDRDSWAVN